MSVDWREAQKDQTRRRIVQAVNEIVAETGQVSVRQVADRSGVSPATIYRYFPNRDALLAGAAYGHVDIGMRPGAPAFSLLEYRDTVRKVFEAHESDLPTVIAGHSTPPGRAMRRTRAANRLAIIREQMQANGVDVESPAGRRLVAVAAVVASSRSFLEFHEMTDLTTTEAADAVAWAIGAITEATLNGRELEDYPSPARPDDEQGAKP